MTVPPEPLFAAGESVAVRTDVTHPDVETELGGWQGRVTEVTADEIFGELAEVEWDSITLEQMPADYITTCDEEGIDWTRTTLPVSALMPARPRDEIDDVTRVAAELSDRLESAGYGVGGAAYEAAQAERIAQITAVAGEGQPALAVWASYLADNLDFPFAATVAAFQPQGPLNEGDDVQVERIVLVDDEHGVLVGVDSAGRSYDFPLNDLEVVDESDPNYQIVDDYSVWYDQQAGEGT
ncbi:MAG: calcium-binding protein [Candidatus Promineifilaceae bacterium]|nr:calcium-binding protein [Candidatus Promineifilaceae bacterium]